MTPQAQQIVDMFMPYASYIDGNRNVSTDTIQLENAIKSAIVAVEMAKSELAYAGGSWAIKRVSTLQSILTELKNELNSVG